MKKVVSFLAAAACVASLFAARSFKNNTYQKLADEYTRKARWKLLNFSNVLFVCCLMDKTTLHSVCLWLKYSIASDD